MENSTQNFIISEFEKQRKQVNESNAPNDDFKIIRNIANSLNMKFSDVLNVIEENKNNAEMAKYANGLQNYNSQVKNKNVLL